jgi:hypothetical protein
VDKPRPSPSTKWTRRVPHPVLIGHAASLTPYGQAERALFDPSAPAARAVPSAGAGAGGAGPEAGPQLPHVAVLEGETPLHAAARAAGADAFWQLAELGADAAAANAPRGQARPPPSY